MATLCKRPDCKEPFDKGAFWSKYCSRRCGIIVRSRRAYAKKHPICKECQDPIEVGVEDLLCDECRKKAERAQG